jgi:hypothetical protein
MERLVAVGPGSSLLVACHGFEIVLEDEKLMGAHENSLVESERKLIVLDRLQVGGSGKQLEQYLGMLPVLCWNYCSPAAVRVDLLCLLDVVVAALISVEVSPERYPLTLQPHFVSGYLRWSQSFLVGDLLLGYMDPK